MGTSASVNDDRISSTDIQLEKSFVENNTNKISMYGVQVNCLIVNKNHRSSNHVIHKEKTRKNN
jgi:hypothetical protein